MPNKTYDEQFKPDAVTVYDNPDGAPLQKIAHDLSINRETLKNPITTYTTSTQPAQSSTGSALSQAQRIRALKKKNTLLRQERDILPRAATYFAEETN